MVFFLEDPKKFDRLCYAGFTGILMDDRGYDVRSAMVFRILLRERLRGKSVETNSGSSHFFPLEDHRNLLIRELGQSEFDLRCRAEREQARVLWLAGFVSFEPVGEEDKHRWCGRRGTMVIVNPSSIARTFTTSMILRSSTESEGQLVIEGGEVWSETLPLSKSSPLIERVWVVPPGRHTVAFRYAPPREHVPSDSRDTVFFIANFAMTEVKETR
jgi:hypothetical protein